VTGAVGCGNGVHNLRPCILRGRIERHCPERERNSEDLEGRDLAGTT